MNLLHKTSKILITGKSGKGKSTYFKRYVLSAFGHEYSKVLIFDHQGEMQHSFNMDASIDEDTLLQQWQKGFVVFDPSHIFPGESYLGWDFFCDWVFMMSESEPDSKKLIAVDELQMFASTQSLSWEQCLVVETGRKFGLDFLAIAQQMNLIHNRLRNQLTEIVTFQHTDKLILDALEEKGFDPVEVANLPDLEYLLRTNYMDDTLKGRVDILETPA